MNKKYIIIKLAPHVSSWCDKENNIYLSVPNKMSKRLKEGCDMKMINKGVKAGLIMMKEYEEVVEEKVENVSESVKDKIEKAKRRSRTKKVEEVQEEVKDVKDEVRIEVNIIKDEEEDKDGE